MTKRLTYTNVDMNGLHDELLTAGIVPAAVGGVFDADAGAEVEGAVEIHVADDVDEAAVAAVVAAHDRGAVVARRAASEQAGRDDVATLRAFLAAPNGSATNAQRDAVLKAFIRVARRRFEELRD